jgi:hypothetical protein
MESRSKFKQVLIGVAFMLVLGLDPVMGFAQTFGEFFNQKKTQKRYLLEQIAALKVYLGYAKKGYEIVGTGLQTVKDITSGEFSLHSTFISSLSAVSPFVRDNVKVAQIIAYQLEIVKSFNGVRSDGDGFLSASNLAYLLSVRAVVLAECSADLQELILVVTPGLVEMAEQERLLRLDKLYLSMQNKAGFTRDFCADVATLSAFRKRESFSIDFLNRIYENK